MAEVSPANQQSEIGEFNASVLNNVSTQRAAVKAVLLRHGMSAEDIAQTEFEALMRKLSIFGATVEEVTEETQLQRAR